MKKKKNTQLSTILSMNESMRLVRFSPYVLMSHKQNKTKTIRNDNIRNEDSIVQFNYIIKKKREKKNGNFF